VETISYPYEWCFSELKDAALATLAIQKKALARGMVLKDASAFNIQFWKGQPVFIDTLSFERYQEGLPWVAYRQFCQHFLAPLAIMTLVDPRLGKLSRGFVDGIPLEIASNMLPWKSKFSVGLGMHIHAHAKVQKGAMKEEPQKPRSGKFSKVAMLGLIDNLESTVKGLSWKAEGTVWGDYYDNTNYSDEAFQRKHRLVSDFLDRVTPAPRLVWDLGANTGEFSRLSSERGIATVAWDIDDAAVEKNYQQVKRDKEQHLLPLIQDLTNPSPSLGWAHVERDSFVGRGPADVALALALVHHLAIGNNVPLPDVAEFFARTANWLIIEFVPKSDSQVQRLLATREDVFPGYTEPDFEVAFKREFHFEQIHRIEGTERTLYLMKRK
jgi:hypothetical protein